jgi:hypothetical protein
LFVTTPDFSSVVAIPTVENGGNHTPAFTDAAQTIEAHKACLNVSKALAGVGVRVLTDEAFMKKVSADYAPWISDEVLTSGTANR